MVGDADRFGSLSRSRSMIRAAACALLLAVVEGRGAPAAEPRVLVPGLEAASGGAAVLSRSLASHGFEVSGGKETRLDAASLAGIDVVLLGASSTALLEAAGESGHRALAAAVRAGAGLVVLGDAIA